MVESKHEVLRLESRLESVDRAQTQAQYFASEAGFSEADRHEVAMAVREIVINAIAHGNAYDPAKRVKLEFELTPAELVIEIQDEGAGFDPNHQPDPLAPENLMRQSGRGMLLARAFMDQIDFYPSPHGTSVRMCKHRPSLDGRGCSHSGPGANRE